MFEVKIVRQAALAAALLGASSTAAQAIGAQFTADNFMRLAYGTATQTVMVPPVNDPAHENDWTKISKYDFEIPAAMLADRTCKIQIVTWGDRVAAEGLAGWISGDHTIATGPMFRGMNTGVAGNASLFNPGSPPTPAMMQTWRNQPHGIVSIANPVGVQTPWSRIALTFVGPGNNGIRWIYDAPGFPGSETGPNYRSFVIPCARVKNPVRNAKSPRPMKQVQYQSSDHVVSHYAQPSRVTQSGTVTVKPRALARPSGTGVEWIDKGKCSKAGPGVYHWVERDVDINGGVLNWAGHHGNVHSAATAYLNAYCAANPDPAGFPYHIQFARSCTLAQRHVGGGQTKYVAHYKGCYSKQMAAKPGKPMGLYARKTPAVAVAPCIGCSDVLTNDLTE